MSTLKSAELAAEEITRAIVDHGTVASEDFAAIIEKHFPPPQPLPVSGETPRFASEDIEDSWSKEIWESHPLNTKSDKEYAVALEMVGNRHSKYALVELVNWLLVKCATERVARELIEDASRKMSFENATLHLRVVAAEARISELESENQNHAEHVLLERGLRQAAEAARELAEKERDSSRNFADSLMSNLDQIRIATEWLDDGFGPNTATALALKAARELKRIKELRGTHDCDCEICSRTSKVCPATTSSYALALMEAEARASVAESKSGDVAKLAILAFNSFSTSFAIDLNERELPLYEFLKESGYVDCDDHGQIILLPRAALASVPADKGQG